jgi:thiamine-phosphate pyrophosphorylase
VVDRSACGGRDLDEICAAAIAGGAEMIQLREKTEPSGTIFPLAKKLAARCRAAGVPFIMNDRVDLAVAVDADGVHLGQEDLPPAAARAIMKPGMLLGLSTHSEEQAAAAQAAGADYVAVGSMFPTTTKTIKHLVGPPLARRVRPLVKVPLIGIGGITPENVGEVPRSARRRTRRPPRADSWPRSTPRAANARPPDATLCGEAGSCTKGSRERHPGRTRNGTTSRCSRSGIALDVGRGGR